MLPCAQRCRKALLSLTLLCSGAPAGATETPAAGPWGDVRLVEDLRIGSYDGPEETIFGRISYLTVGPEGSIYVADDQLETLRAYDADGRFVRTIGRKGEAPGEYLLILGMTVLPNGNLAIYDGRNQRITIYKPDGDALHNFRVSNSLFASDMLHHDVEGNLYLWSREPAGGQSNDWREFLLQVSPTGKTLGRISLPEEEADTGSLHPATLWAWSPLGYLVVGNNENYSLEMRLPDAPRHITHPYEPVAVLPEERDQWLAWDEYFRKRSLERGQPAASHTIPARKPAFKNLCVGDDGRIWVQRYVAAEKQDVPPRAPGDKRPLFPWREPQVFDVFAPEGAFLGSIEMPRSTRVLFRRGQQLWGVRTDDDGERVVRFRIEKQ